MLDHLDQTVIDGVRECHGTVVDWPHEAGGWPEIERLQGPGDSDRDGMPDAWEMARGLDANSPKDAWADRDKDGWSNLEEYLSTLAGDVGR